MLRLFVSRTGKTPQPLRVYAIDADNQTWDEETACRNNQPITDALIEEFTAVEDKTAEPRWKSLSKLLKPLQ